jgi:hypothetical protein
MRIKRSTFKRSEKARRVKGEGEAQNMRFCETNPIRHDAICDVTRRAESSYERAAQKTNRVRLERNEARGGGTMGMSCPRFQRSGGCRNRDRYVAPTRMEGDLGAWGLYRMAMLLE